MASTHFQPVKRLNATLPDALAQFVAEMTGEGGLYETPSELVRDLIRRYMEKMAADESHTLNRLLRQSISENHYTPVTAEDSLRIRQALI